MCWFHHKLIVHISFPDKLKLLVSPQYSSSNTNCNFIFLSIWVPLIHLPVWHIQCIHFDCQAFHSIFRGMSSSLCFMFVADEVIVYRTQSIIAFKMSCRDSAWVVNLNLIPFSSLLKTFGGQKLQVIKRQPLWKLWGFDHRPVIVAGSFVDPTCTVYFRKFSEKNSVFQSPCGQKTDTKFLNQGGLLISRNKRICSQFIISCKLLQKILLAIIKQNDFQT